MLLPEPASPASRALWSLRGSDPARPHISSVTRRVPRGPAGGRSTVASAAPVGHDETLVGHGRPPLVGPGRPAHRARPGSRHRPEVAGAREEHRMGARGARPVAAWCGRWSVAIGVVGAVLVTAVLSGCAGGAPSVASDEGGGGWTRRAVASGRSAPTRSVLELDPGSSGRFEVR